LAKGDIAGSISSIIFARWQHASRSWLCEGAFGIPISGNGWSYGVSDGTIQKEW